MDPSEAHQAALAIFIRYGYRKTSMEDIAGAVGVSRQWIYQQFESKQRLFSEVIEHALKGMLERALVSLNAGAANTETRLLSAFDGWCGEYLDSIAASPHASELFDSAVSIHGEQIRKAHDTFEKSLAKTIGQLAPKLPVDVQAKDVASVLMQTSDALKHSCENRKDYLDHMTRAIRVVLSGRTGTKK